MKRVMKWLPIVLSMLMVLSLVVGCTGSATTTTATTATTATTTAASETTASSGSTTASESVATTTTEATADLTEFADMIVYQFGEPQLDMPVVVDALNVKLKEDLNCSLKFNYIPWTDYQTKYSLLLASGEPIDMIYTATWTPFIEHAQKGAFMPIEELLPAYAPQSYGRFNEMDWAEASYDGHIYALPSYVIMLLPDSVMYRDDLRKKYNLEPIDSLATMEAYMQAIKDNEPEMIPYHASTTLDRGLQFLFQVEYGLAAAPTPLNNLMVYKETAEQEFMRELQVVPFMPEFEAFITKMRDWYNRGFWSRSVTSNNVTSMESMVNGKSGIAICHIDRSKGDVGDKILAENPSWEPKAWFPCDNTKILFRAATLQDATAIPRTSRYPERALMALELLINDREYYDLLMYGVEGKHYVLDADGKIAPPEGVTAQNNAFNPEGLNTWNMRNQDFIRLSAAPNQWMDYYSAKERMMEYSIKSKLNAFQLNLEPIRAELAAITQLDQQYMLPLLYGTVDPVSGLAEYRTQLEKAGINKVLEEVKSQIAAYADKFGY